MLLVDRALRRGRRLARRGAGQPSPLFDEPWYVSTYADVATSGLEPWEHYRFYGAAEGRKPNVAFEPGWYVATYPECGTNRFGALDHYLRDGWVRGYDPGPDFSTRDYLATHPDLRAEGTNPLVHLLSGDGLGGQAPQGRIDLATLEMVTGWAWDASDPGAQIEVEIRVDDDPIGTITASTYREDLRDAGIGDGSHSFSMVLEPKRHRLESRVELLHAGTQVRLASSTLVAPADDPPSGPLVPPAVPLSTDASPRPRRARSPSQSSPCERTLVAIPIEPMADLDARATPRNGAVIGALTSCDSSHARGWVVDTASPARHVVVELYGNNRIIGRVVANESRPELERDDFIVDGHGFSYLFPAPLVLDGPDDIHVRALVADTDDELDNSPWWITRTAWPGR